MKVALLSSGVDFAKRGYETHIIQLLQSMLTSKYVESQQVMLFKNTGENTPNEMAIHALDRRSKIVGFLAKFRGDKLYWEAIFFFLKLVRKLRTKQIKVDVVYVQEPMIAKLCYRLKKLLPGNPVIVFKHGVANNPNEIHNTFDKLIQINLEHFQKYISFYPEDKHKVHLIPNYLTPDYAINQQQFNRKEMLSKYGILADKKILLIVGLINANVKKTDYVIEEVSKLDDSWLLVACGRGDEELIALGKKTLNDRFKQLYLNKEDLKEIYQLADAFVLASPNEGFGNVILEAMAFEKPIIAHKRKLNEWILESNSELIEMGVEGCLSNFLQKNFNKDWALKVGKRNKAIFEKRFNWNAVEKDVLNVIYAANEKD